jgi:hypothetical protein
MVFTAYDGILTGGLLTFLLVLFAILSIAALIWFVLYIEMSQRKNWKLSISILLINSLLIAFEIQLILLKVNVVF